MIPPLAALFAWPAAVAILFQKLRPEVAIMAAVIGGYLLLPERTVIDLPLLPPFNKHTVPILSVLVMLWLVVVPVSKASALPGLLPRHPVPRLFLPLLVAGAFLTVMTNGDTLVYGATVRQGLRPYDGFSEILNAIMMLLPLLVARKYLADAQSHRLLLKVFCVAGLAYSLLALFEIRMSPQLNNLVYGFFPHSWAQHVRGGGYRPLVFLGHGLLLAIFFFATISAALGLSRLYPERRGAFLLAALWLLGTLFLSKSLGGWIIALALAPIVLFLGVRSQLIVAAVIAGLFLSYPVARSSGLIPIGWISEQAARISADRAASLQTRLDNEDRMLAKAEERPLFGWGGWGRSRVYNEQGNDITIADGLWIIVLGVNGWVGYVTRFGLLAAPIFILLLKSRRSEIGMESSVLAIIMAGNLVDMIPNSSITPLTWLIAGALWGRLELGAEASQTVKPDVPLRSAPGYRRPLPTGPAVAAAAETGEEEPRTPVYTRQTGRIPRSRP